MARQSYARVRVLHRSAALGPRHRGGLRRHFITQYIHTHLSTAWRGIGEGSGGISLLNTYHTHLSTACSDLWAWCVARLSTHLLQSSCSHVCQLFFFLFFDGSKPFFCAFAMAIRDVLAPHERPSRQATNAMQIKTGSQFGPCSSCISTRQESRTACGVLRSPSRSKPAGLLSYHVFGPVDSLVKNRVIGKHTPWVEPWRRRGRQMDFADTCVVHVVFVCPLCAYIYWRRRCVHGAEKNLSTYKCGDFSPRRAGELSSFGRRSPPASMHAALWTYKTHEFTLR